MSEVRRPDAVFKVDSKSGAHRFEIFKSSQFSPVVTEGQKLYDKTGRETYRVRQNGIWMPPGKRHFVTLAQLRRTLEGYLLEALGEPVDE